MKTARHLALPATVALHTRGSVLVSLATWAVLASSASPGALGGGLWVLSYTIAAVAGAVLDYRALGGTGMPRAGHLVGELGVPPSWR